MNDVSAAFSDLTVATQVAALPPTRIPPPEQPADPVTVPREYSVIALLSPTEVASQSSAGGSAGGMRMNVVVPYSKQIA